MRRVLTACLLPCLLAASAAVAKAQASSNAGRKIDFERVDLGEAASELPVSCVQQDGRGFIWIGGRDGVVRHDGIDSRRLGVPSGKATWRASEPVSCMARAIDGGIWIGTSHGLAYAAAGSDEVMVRGPHARTREELWTTRVDDLCVDKRGRVWLVGQSLRCYDPGRDATEQFARDRLRELLGTDEEMDGRTVVAVRTDETGDVWLLTNRGLLAKVAVETDRGERLDWLQSTGENRPGRGYRLAVLGDQLCIGTDVGAFLVDVATGACTEILYGGGSHVGGQSLRSVLRDRDGQLWLGTSEHGLALVEQPGMSEHRFHHDPASNQGLPDDSISCLFQDRSGALWVGTPAGLARGDARRRFRCYTLASSAAGEDGAHHGGAIHKSRDGTVWLGNGDDGLARIDPQGRLQLFAPQDIGLRDGWIAAIAAADPGRLWLGTRRGLHLLDCATARIDAVYEGGASRADNSDACSVRAIAPAADQRLWIATSMGLDVFDPATAEFRSIDLDRLLDQPGPHRFVVGGLHTGTQDDVWAVLIGGRLLHLQQTGAIEQIRLRELPGTESLLAVLDLGERLLLTTGAGLLECARDGSDLRAVPNDAGRLQRPTSSMLLGASGRLWIGTTLDGLLLLDERRGYLRSFGNGEGFVGSNVYLGTMHRAFDDEILFGCREGLVRFYEQDVCDSPPPPHVALIDFRVHGESRAKALVMADELTLPHQDNSFSFDFAALDFVGAKRNRYAYLLDGFDADWIDGDTRRSARYTNVGAGTYTFRVKAANADGVWSQPSIAFRLTITPALWQRTWFRAAVAMLAFALLGGYWHYARALAQRGRRLQQEYEQRIVAQGKSRQLEVQLRQAQKMEAVGRMAGGIAHDFNNLLTAILGHAEVAGLMLDRPAAQRDVIESLGEIKKAAERATGLTRQLLMFSRAQPQSPTACDVNAVLRDLERMIRPLVRENIRTVLELADDLPPILIDEVHFGQVILNLVVNASDAMPDGGRLEIRTTSSTTVDGVEITVTDTGSGIPPEEIDRIFDPFYSSKPIGQGTGLGLATVHGIVRQAGGTIEVSSRVGAGTTFRLQFPGAEALPATTALAPAAAQRRVEGQVVLVCEDDDPVRQLTTEILRRQGYRVIECSTPAAAITASQERDQRIDLLVTDVIMPQMNGHELAKTVQQNHPSTPVLFVSGYTADALGDPDVGRAAANYLAKPFSRAGLLERVREILTDSKSAEVADDDPAS